MQAICKNWLKLDFQINNTLNIVAVTSEDTAYVMPSCKMTFVAVINTADNFNLICIHKLIRKNFILFRDTTCVSIYQIWENMSRDSEGNLFPIIHKRHNKPLVVVLACRLFDTLPSIAIQFKESRDA